MVTFHCQAKFSPNFLKPLSCLCCFHKVFLSSFLLKFGNLFMIKFTICIFKGGLGGEISLSDVIIHLELEGKNTRDNYCSVIITSNYLGAEVFFFIHDAIVTWYCGFAAHRSSNWYMSPGATLKFSTS